MTASSPSVEVSWHARDREAFLIAQLLRDSRLTVLYGDAGAGKTTLLKTGVLPLLRRRVGDRKLLKSGESRVVVPFPDRRGIGSPDQCAAEVAICFDRWTGAPLAALQAQLFSALPIGCARMASPVRPLADPLAAWSKELRVRFLIIFDRFDEYLAAPLDRAGIREFADQFALVVSEPLLPANFLISLRDEKLLLERFQQRIAGLGNASLRLPPLPHLRARPETRQDQAVSHRVPITAAPAPAAAAAPEIWHAEQSTAPDAAEIAPGAPPPSHGRWMPVLKWTVISVGLASLLVIGATVLEPTAQQGSQQPPVQAAADIESIAPMPSVTPPAAGVPPALPHVGLVADVANSTDERIAHDLSRVVAPDAGIGLVVPVEASSNITPLFAIVRYDAIQAARTGDAAAREAIDRLRIVTSLYVEEIHLVVRRDSPLVFIHDLREARINLGPAQSSRGQTIALLYERMFNTSIQGANASFLSDEDALTKLVTDKTIDAMAVIAGQPDRWLAGLKPQMRHSIKLLKLDHEHSASRRAIEAYLPAVVRAASYGAWLHEDTPTLAVMSFLVTSDYADEASIDRIRMFARSLCRNLPILRRDGHPKWREVQPDLQLEMGLRYSVPAFAAFYSCRAENLVGKSVVRKQSKRI